MGHWLMRVIAALALGGVLSTSADAATWQKYTYDNDGFSVDFSGDVTVKPMALSEETAKKTLSATSYLQDGGSFAYVAGATHSRVGFNFDAGATGTFRSYKCEVVISDVSLPIENGQGREMHRSKCVDGTYDAVGRFYLQGDWFYQVVYMIPTASDPADADHFLNSFKLLAK